MPGSLSLFSHSHPPMIPSPQVRNELVSLIDTTATISDIAGAPPDSQVKMSGNSLVKLFSEQNWPKHVFIELKRFLGISAVRSEDFKLVEYRTESGPVYEFYDLKNDPYELENKASDPGFAAIREQMLITMEDF